MQTMTMHYSWPLIAASICVSIIAAYAAFCFAERLCTAQGSRRRWWLAGGSTVMGFGIWSMHYLGMLAVSMPMDVRYSLPLVGLSLLLAIGAACVALNAVGREKVSTLRLAGSASLMGAGIGAMHYTGMAAMECAAAQRYSVLWVAMSVLVALCFSYLSLVITFRLRDEAIHSEGLRLCGAAVMGLGIASMHYTAMHAVVFSPGVLPASWRHGVHVGMLGELGVLLTVALVLAGALVAAVLDRVTYRQLRDAHAELEAAHQRLIEAQETLLASERALAEANHCLQELSIRDGLTQLYNRRYFNDAVEAEWRRTIREKAMLAFLIIDVDHFKRWNDTCGHAAGDQLLRAIAGVLNRLTQATGGVLARYGGEEFAALLPVTREMESYIYAEQMREAVAAIRPAGDAAADTVTVSIGLVSATSRIFSGPEDALRAADAALYRAKHLGRNRVEIAETPFISGRDLATGGTEAGAAAFTA